MQSVMGPLKKFMGPVCDVFQSNKSMISFILVLLIVFMILPFDRFFGTNVKNNLIRNLSMLGSLVNFIFAALVLCFYFSNDPMNLVLTLGAYFVLRR